MQHILGETGKAHKPRDPLRARAERVSQELELEPAPSGKPRGRDGEPETRRTLDTAMWLGLEKSRF
jgi:hypothetical protein